MRNYPTPDCTQKECKPLASGIVMEVKSTKKIEYDTTAAIEGVKETWINERHNISGGG